MLYKVFPIREPPNNAQIMTKEYRLFGSLCMEKQVMEILMTISRFDIHICNNFTVLIVTLRSGNTMLSLLDSNVNSRYQYGAHYDYAKNFEALAHHVFR